MVGIVVLNYKSSTQTIKCIEKIIEHTNVEYHIYIVDNFSQDSSYDILLNYFLNDKRITVIQSTINGGYSAGNNLGARKAIEDGCKYILIINNDVELLNNAIDMMVSSLEKHSDACIVGPSVLSTANQETQTIIRKLNFRRYILNKKPLRYIGKLRRLSDREVNFLTEEKEFISSGMVYGCCFLIDAKVFSDFGLFDENLFLYHEEDILAYKLEYFKLNSIFLKEAKVMHHHSYTISKEGIAFERYHRYISSLYALRAYGGVKGVQLYISILVNLIPYIFNSLNQKSYRRLLIKFINEIKKIIKINPGCKMKMTLKPQTKE